MADLIVARSEELESRVVDGEVVLLDLRSQLYLSLNRTGAELWPLIVEGVARDRLVSEVCSRHGIDAEIAARDVDVLIKQLREADLLQPEGNAAAPDPG
jgi:hypothetical protein